jgi:hypothetical protein
MLLYHYEIYLRGRDKPLIMNMEDKLIDADRMQSEMKNAESFSILGPFGDFCTIRTEDVQAIIMNVQR